MGEAGEIGNESVLLKVHSFPEVQLLVARWLVVDQTVEAASGREVWTVMSARKTAELTHIHRQRAGSDQAEHAAAVRCGAVRCRTNQTNPRRQSRFLFFVSLPRWEIREGPSFSSREDAAFLAANYDDQGPEPTDPSER